jgi:hypothetical protein
MATGITQSTHGPKPNAMTLGRCVMQLHDGRTFDLTGMTVDEVTTLMNELQITPAQVASVMHFCDLGATRRVH